MSDDSTGTDEAPSASRCRISQELVLEAIHNLRQSTFIDKMFASPERKESAITSEFMGRVGKLRVKEEAWQEFLDLKHLIDAQEDPKYDLRLELKKHNATVDFKYAKQWRRVMKAVRGKGELISLREVEDRNGFYIISSTNQCV